ncbi:MAG: methylenetetrahydrofolate reductase [Bacteroidaceae bacterium]|jgi:methylenetetrahydrofolate reductase (NADPH)|nr:methylenetetrahydrofolate reductase [NAD(P)H] [Bacteroidaceae bacterium]
MTVSEILKSCERTAFSFEVLPPLKGTGTAALFRTIDSLRVFDPKYINITTHRSEYVYSEQPDGSFLRSSVRRRPGTVAVASAIMQKYNIKVVPHIVVSGMTKEELEYNLLDLQFLGIQDLLVLRGDKAKDESRFMPVKDGYTHATELIEQVNEFNAGRFVDGSPIKASVAPFAYGVACYPEKHEEAPNIDFDIQILKKKQDLGASYAVTQLFYDNKKYFDFVEKARSAGVTIPIIPGIKPLTKAAQLSVIPKTFHLDFPEDLLSEALKCKSDDDLKCLGVEWAVEQCKDLIRFGVPSIHFYTMSAVDSIRLIASQVY